MTTETPRTTAWHRIRAQVEQTVEAYRADGNTVIEAIADHGTVHTPTDGPATFVFTLPGETIERLRQRVSEDAISQTEIQYGDVDTHRLYLLTVQTTTKVTVVIAGGVRHDRLSACANASGRAQTRLRGIDGTVGLQLEHDDVAPFVCDLE